jgi:pectinesterase
VFINCFLDKHVRSEGWDNWNKPDAERTAYYAEYKSHGPGANLPARVSWSHQLTDEQASQYSFKNIMGDWILGK